MDASGDPYLDQFIHGRATARSSRPMTDAAPPSALLVAYWPAALESSRARHQAEQRLCAHLRALAAGGPAAQAADRPCPMSTAARLRLHRLRRHPSPNGPAAATPAAPGTRSSRSPASPKARRAAASAPPAAGASRSATSPPPSRRCRAPLSGIAELDRVLGGGLVPASAILSAATPASASRRCCCRPRPPSPRRGAPAIYVSGEEADRADPAARRPARPRATRRCGSPPRPTCATS